MNVGKKSKMYDEESKTLPVTFVQQIMQHDSCVAIPEMKAIPQGPNPSYYIAIRDMQSQNEYMHPIPLPTLQNYQIHFINCPLMRSCDMSTEIKSFPPLKPPGEMGMGHVSMELVKFECGKLFKVTAVCSPSAGNVTIFVQSPPLPMSQPHYDEMYPTSMDKRFCLMRYAILALAKDAQMDLSLQENKDIGDGMNDDEKKDAVLQHGGSVIKSSGTCTYILSGACNMHEIERTAATVSLPLVFKYLYFLQFNLEQDMEITYHIMAPNKFAYMVHLPNVAGWKIYYQVNMSASFPSLQYAFAESQTFQDILGKIPRRNYSELAMTNLFSQMTLASRSLGKTSLVLDKIATALSFSSGKIKQNIQEKSAADPSPLLSALPSDIFQLEMMLQGMKILEKEIVQQRKEYHTFTSIQTAKPLLHYLVSFFSNNVIIGSGRANQAKPPHMSAETILGISLQVFESCVRNVWDRLSADSDKKRVPLLLSTLGTDSKDCYVYIDPAYIPVILNGCMHCPPSTWWEILASNCRVQDPSGTAAVSTCLCTTWLFHGDKYSAYFPHMLFFGQAFLDQEAAARQAQWEALIERACVPYSELAIARDTYKLLCVEDKARYKQNPDRSLMKYRRPDYCRAVAYLMLLGNPKNMFADIKPM